MTLGIPKGMKENANSISIAFCLDVLIRNEYITFKECKKTPFEIILYVGRVTSLQSWVATLLTTLTILKACNSPYIQYYLKRFFVLHSLEVIFSFLIKKSRQKAIEIENCIFFIPLGIPRAEHWIISFVLHISVVTSPTN